MKIIILILLLSISSTSFAGGYYSGEYVDEYDQASGLYFKSLKTVTEQGGFLNISNSIMYSDINIFDPAANSNVLLFNDQKNRTISSFLYESGYNEETHSIQFRTSEDSYNQHHHIKNNHSIEKRAPKDRLLLVVSNEKQKNSTMFSFEKSGKNMQKIKTFPADVDWHIDVKNAKIRFICNTGNAIKIESLDW